MSENTLKVDGTCEYCGKDLSQQDWVQVCGTKVYCNENCMEKDTERLQGEITDVQTFEEMKGEKALKDKLYGVTGEDGYTRIATKKEDLPRPESIGAEKIVEVKSSGD